LADLVRINFPWGSLLRGLIEPQPPVLAAIASPGKAGAHFELVLSYLPEHDTGAFAGAALPALDEARIETLRPDYAVAGLVIEEWRQLTQDEALALPSSWGRRLLHSRPRPVFEISGRIRPTG
jgi:16S rRNA (adenine(1408)-N(1))-methyltransferase